MPLRVGDNHDKGGNTLQVRWFNSGFNLHRVWDSGILDRAGRGENGWLDDLIAMDTPEARRKAQAGSFENSLTEFRGSADQAVLDLDRGNGSRRRPSCGREDATSCCILSAVNQSD
jgi:hypothetical protein